MIATCVPQEELGKVYALIATAECIVPLGVSQAYASLFKATKNTFPGAVFFVSCYLILATIILVLWITVMLKGRRLSQVIVKEEETGLLKSQIYHTRIFWVRSASKK